MKAIYEYRERIEQEEREEARDVVIGFKKESMDPNRPIVNWERKVQENLKKRMDQHRKLNR